jgi:CHAD domain-containing protein
MADLSQDAKLTPEMPLLKANARLFSYLWKQMWAQAAGTASGDADALHDMRVALRRLRSALQNFEGEKNAPLLDKRVTREYAKWRKKLGRIGDELGAVRDHDVLDEYLKAYAKEKLQTETLPEGLAHFERYLQTERAQHFAPMVKRINRATEPRSTREEFARWALGLPGMDAPPLLLGEAAKLILRARLDDVFALAPGLAQSVDVELHHDFRKSLRRLRYALETLGVCFSVSLKEPLKTLVAAQDVLGEMQDRSVLEETARRAFGDEIPEDVTAFLHFGELRRRRLLGQARAWWKAEETGVMQQLRDLL